jgi:hypothetical protein
MMGAGSDVVEELFNVYVTVPDKQLNQFLNENWKDVFEYLSPTVSSVVAEIAYQIKSALHKMVPFDVAFPEKMSR